MAIELATLLAELSERTKEKFGSMPAVVIKDDSFDVSALPINKAEWHRLTDVVAVVADLKSSTQLDERRKPQSTASIYDAGVGGVVRVFRDLEADFVDIQGDGGFGLFWGAKRYERALCAAITIRTFSDQFTKQLEAKWPNAPTTGFKVGVASGGVLAKRVGIPRHLDFQEPVWAGKPVNYAAKTAQQTVPEELVVTASVWDVIEGNDYLRYSCGCVGGEPDKGVVALWDPCDIEKLPDLEQHGHKIKSVWCPTHGEDFCRSILAGLKTRTDVPDAVREEVAALTAAASLEFSIEKLQRAVIREQVATDLKEARINRARGL